VQTTEELIDEAVTHQRDSKLSDRDRCQALTRVVDKLIARLLYHEEVFQALQKIVEQGRATDGKPARKSRFKLVVLPHEQK